MRGNQVDALAPVTEKALRAVALADAVPANPVSPILTNRPSATVALAYALMTKMGVSI
jgi:hypothetical protein